MERLVKTFAVAVILFFIVLGFVIGSRMDQNTIALLGGTTIGLLIAAPCAAIITYLAIRNRDESRQFDSPQYRPPQPPMQYWVVPQAPIAPQSAPHYNALAGTSPYTMPTEQFVLPPRRKFYLIGESGESSEIEPEADSGS